ncbi:MAG: ATP-binding cassette domain-containing protein, partial [Rhodobacteraceae bacterium]|nr:ATP-binding cassette domain-containing protein [Paracoccaceae bacterium]
KPGQLSGGQRQRVAIGRSIVRAPKIFLFDEPLSNLDAALRGDMRVELSQLHRELDATMVYVTHDQVEAMTMADRIVVLRDGRVEQFGTPMELYHHPATKFVAGFIGQPNMNFLPCKVVRVETDGLLVELPGQAGQLQVPVEVGLAMAGDRVELGIRPEDLLQGTGSDLQNGALQMQVDVLERLGGISITHGSLIGADGAAPLKLCASLPGSVKITEGVPLQLQIPAAAAHVFDATGQVMRRLQAPSVAEG